MNDPLIHAVHGYLPLSDPLEEVDLRAAELLDLVYEHLAAAPGRPGSTESARV